MGQISEEQPWSTFKPRGWWARLTMLLVRLGVGRGAARRWIRGLWLRGDSGTVADVTRNGLKWRLDFSNSGADSYMLFSSKERDRREVRAITKACSDGVFVDIGANIGYYAVRLASAGVRVLALEPNPIAHRRMLVNLRLNDLADRAVALPIGVGEEGETELFFGGIESGSTVLPGPNRLMIRTSPLADILISQGIRAVDALKIDVEGGEDRALVPFFRSTSRDLWPRCIVIEDCHRDHWETDIIALLQDQGYRSTERTRANLILVR